MNLTLLKKIEGARRGILATIIKTEGHTYKKKGEKALYEVDDPLPVCGNIGAGCVDQEILTRGKEAFARRKPVIVRIDTSDPSDIVFGYGTFCGGVIEVLLEPVFREQKKIYRELMDYLEKTEDIPRKEPVYLIHDPKTGAIRLSRESPRPFEGIFIEEIHPPENLYIFGATPLAQQVIKCLDEMDFRIHLVDWRASYLAKFENVDHIRLHEEFVGFDESSMVLVLSHHFERDRDVLKRALIKGCTYVGLLSSETRRDRIFEELKKEGISESMLERVSSPVGLDINSKSDAEIAVSIVAQLVRFKNHSLDRTRRSREE
ncbi:MAG: XdhC family protein [Candidatus Glassbacteria bacterium]